MELLAHYFATRRRYHRSINLERDLDVADSVLGYVPSSRAIDMISRFYRAYSNPFTVRAWTLTGVYGTGKSAFAHFLISLCAGQGEPIKINAINILEETTPDSELAGFFHKGVSQRGLIRAVATASREPISSTVLRALSNGASRHWNKITGPKPKVLVRLNALCDRAARGEAIQSLEIIEVVREIAKATDAGLLLVIDELGKNLEFGAHSQVAEDLYLLQQLAELPSGERDPKVFIIGLLHQSFSDYANRLTSIQRNEWAKVQGRFEDIPFSESPEHMMRLIGKVIDKENAEGISIKIQAWAEKWHKALDKETFVGITTESLYSVYPLHPLSAYILPSLCYRYGQNDRSMFTFFTGSEPYSFTRYINEIRIDGEYLPTLKLHQLYDYFLSNNALTISSRPDFQRWVEIQDRIAEATNLSLDLQLVLKTVGLFNLIATTGVFRADPSLVVLALCNDPTEIKDRIKWEEAIETLIKLGFLTLRKQVRELRIWQGSDFELEKEISHKIESLPDSIGSLLSRHYPLKPLVALRHSYQTGTMRYFGRHYCDNENDLGQLVNKKDGDGVICYWLHDGIDLSQVPTQTEEGKPIIIVYANEVTSLKQACREFVALKIIDANTPQLQTDGVARREVRQRLTMARILLEKYLNLAIEVTPGTRFLVRGTEQRLPVDVSFNSILSEVLDNTYHRGLHLWNELINRRELTSQAAKARRELMEALLEKGRIERLGIQGNGPEASIYESVLASTLIHRKDGEEWTVGSPSEVSGVFSVWEEIERYCCEAKKTPRPLDELYKILVRPPFGAREGIIPVLVLAVLLKHSEDVSVYFDGSFIPILSTEHIEAMLKKPDRFSVKNIEMAGLQLEIFRELETVLKSPKASVTRNKTLLSIVRPLVSFVKSLPRYTISTRNLSKEAIEVRKVLLQAKEPDELLFQDLPLACGCVLLTDANGYVGYTAKEFRKKLVQALIELESAYGKLLDHCRDQLFEAFSVSGEKKCLREDLRVRAKHLLGRCLDPRLKSFILAAVNDSEEDNQWLEALIMVVADKPADAWHDDDYIGFELKVCDLARKFINLEALQKEFTKYPSEGFDARRITITFPTGNEINQVVWIDNSFLDKVDSIVKPFTDAIASMDAQSKRAIVTHLLEKMLAPDLEKEVTSILNGKEKKYG